MGVLSKAWKGVKTAFKSTARRVKKAFNSFGKFMGKLGVLGQVAMFFIMPYVGAALGGAFTGAAQAASAYTGVGASVVNAAGKVMTYAANAASKVGNTFSNITKGVADTLGNFAKTAGKKMGFTGDMFANASENFFSAGGNGGMSAWEKSTGATSRFANVTEKFTTAIDQTVNESMSKVNEGLQSNLDSKFNAQTLDGIPEGGFDNIPGSVVTPEGLVNPDITTRITSPTIDGLGVVDSSISTATTFGNAPVVVNPDVVSSISNSTLDGTITTLPYTGTPLQSSSLNSIAPAPTNFSPVPDTINLSRPDSRSLLGKTTDYITNQVSSGIDSIKDYGVKLKEDPFGTVATTVLGDDPVRKTAGKVVDQAIATGVQRVAYGAPPTPTIVNNAAFVPSFDSFSGSSQQSGSQPIMGARDFEQNVTNNSNPYGYTAFQYNQYMSQYA